MTLSEAKLHLRVDHTDEDTLISSLIRAARQDVERMCGLALITQTWDWTMDDWPERVFTFPLWPAQSIISIKWKNQAGVESTVDPANYVLDVISRPARAAVVESYSWPAETLYPIGAITIRFAAGFGSDGASVPERYKQAMLLLTGHYYENREAVMASIGANVQLLPLGVTALLADDLTWAR